MSAEGTIKVVKASANIIGGNVKSEDIALTIKGDNIVHGLIGQDVYKFPGAYVAYIKCTFDDGSTRTFPINIDVMSKDDLTKQMMLDRWNQLAELHRNGEDVIPEATRLLKSMEEGGYLTDYIKKMMSNIDEM
jgi:hypothetical protein